MPKRNIKPLFFAAPKEFRAWLEGHHETSPELLVGFYKKSAGKPSITWPESVREALCFGWIDGVRRMVDENSYSIRFTPRRVRSIWSAINIKLAKELTASGLMQPAGLRAFENRQDDKSAVYAYEQRKTAAFNAALGKTFRKNVKAWKFFQSQPPWYRRTATYWVTSAKKDETRQKRLANLMKCSDEGRRIDQLTPTARKKASSGH